MDDSAPPPDLAPPGFSIAPAEQLLRLPGFWPAYYVPTWDDFADEPELFGADGADVDAAVDALYDRWTRGRHTGSPWRGATSCGSSTATIRRTPARTT
ncbi:hypothetical protein ACIRRT_32245 [Streptomyces sp. NPDC102256]|uniref:hypothetical protein n=1 Tax=Streptomyces sp. NPDC102256 TaxID=3366147 RepID=UPI00380E6557